MPPVVWRSCSWRPGHPTWPHRRTSYHGYRVWRHWARDEMSLVEFAIPLSQRGSRCYWCTCSRQCRPLWRSQRDRWCLQRAELWTTSWTQAWPHNYQCNIEYVFLYNVVRGQILCREQHCEQRHEHKHHPLSVTQNVSLLSRSQWDRYISVTQSMSFLWRSQWDTSCIGDITEQRHEHRQDYISI